MSYINIPIPVRINVITYTNILIFQFPSDILLPAIVDDIIDGNLQNVAININFIGFIGNRPPIYVNKSFGVPTIKNNIISNFSIFFEFLKYLLFSILSIFSFLKN